MIRIKIEVFMDSIRQAFTPIVSNDFKSWVDKFMDQEQTEGLRHKEDPYWELKKIRK